MQQSTTEQKNTALNLSSDSNFRSCGKESAEQAPTLGKNKKSGDSPGSKTPTQTSKEGKGSSFKSPSLSSIFKVREIPYLDSKGQKNELSNSDKRPSAVNSPSERQLNQTPKGAKLTNSARNEVKSESGYVESPKDNQDKAKFLTNRNLDAISSSASKLKDIIECKKEEIHEEDSEKEHKSLNESTGSPERTSLKQSAGRIQGTSFLSPSDSLKLNGAGGSKPPIKLTCNCQKSKCLKLYCDCFAVGQVCVNCNCIGCANYHDSKERAEMIEKLIERNPQVLKHKYDDNSKKSTGGGSSEHKSSALLSFKNNKGCKCKKSGCLKKYCECFQAGVQCSEFCICLECQNNSTNTKISRRGYRAIQPHLAEGLNIGGGSGIKLEQREGSEGSRSETRSSEDENEKRPGDNDFIMEVEKFLNKEKRKREGHPEDKEREDFILRQIKKRDPTGTHEGKIKYLVFTIEEEEDVNKNDKEEDIESGKKLPSGIFRKLFHQEEDESAEASDKKNKRIKLKNVFVIPADSHNSNEREYVKV